MMAQKIISFDIKKSSLLTRPLIAPLITTTSKKGKINVAPMSSVGFGSYNPPRITLAIHPFAKTYKNILETKEFVINITSKDMINKVFLCGKKFVGKINKFNKAELRAFSSEKVRPPRIQNCLAWIECRLLEILRPKTLSDRPILFCEPVSASVDANCLKNNGNINYKNFDVLLSLGLSNFTSISEIIRPAEIKNKEMSWDDYMIYSGHKKQKNNGPPYIMVNKNIDNWERTLANPPDSYKKLFEEERKYFVKNITKEANVLDVCCGEGRSIKDMTNITTSIVGIDHDEKAVAHAKKNLKDYPKIKILKAGADSLPFENKKFDFVICMITFGNFADYKQKSLLEMKRILKDDGFIILSVFSEEAFEERRKLANNLNFSIKEIRGTTIIFDDGTKDGIISEQFSKKQLFDIFAEAKLNIVDIRKKGIAYLCKLKK